MKICAIDIGTNSILYLLARIDSKDRLTSLTFNAKTTRLGKLIKNKGILSLKAQYRTITTIKNFLKDASTKGAIHYILAGTSVVREAKNTPEFTKRLYKETGKYITILTESQEAKLVFSAVKHYLPPHQYHWNKNETVIVDIGGGSTELIFCKKGKPVKISSITIGAVNLTERFRNNIGEMEKFAKNRISPYISRTCPTKLIGVGGTVTTIGAILKGIKKYNPNKVHKNVITYNNIIRILKKLSSISLPQRKRLIPFDPKRADIIDAGLVILKVIMDLLNTEKFRICDRGLVYGLALDYLKYTRGTFNLHNIS